MQMLSTEATVNVVVRQWVSWIVEDGICTITFDDFPIQEKGGAI